MIHCWTEWATRSQNQQCVHVFHFSVPSGSDSTLSYPNMAGCPLTPSPGSLVSPRHGLVLNTLLINNLNIQISTNHSSASLLLPATGGWKECISHEGLGTAWKHWCVCVYVCVCVCVCLHCVEVWVGAHHLCFPWCDKISDYPNPVTIHCSLHLTFLLQEA